MVQTIWSGRLEAGEVAAVRDLVALAADKDGRAPVGEHALMRLGDATAASHLLASTPEGELAGYANLEGADDARPVAELTVHPAHRGRGVGAALVGELLARVTANGSPEGRLFAWAHGDHPAATRLAERFGFRRARELWRMRLDLAAELPERALPPGVSLRAFVPGQDEAAVVEVNNRAFSWHPEQGGWGVEEIELREAEPWFDPAGFFLAVTTVDGAEKLVGFHWTKVHEARPDTGGEPIGEVYVVGVDPDAQGGGLGSALTLAGLRHLRAAGLSKVMLYVESDNLAAIRVYQRLGFEHWDSDVQFAH